MKLRPVVFDLDGTLIDSRNDIAAACNRTLVAAGRTPLSADVIATFVGDGARALVERAFGGELDERAMERHLAFFLDDYTAHPADNTVLLPSVHATLDALADRSLAVCTNKASRTTLAVLEALDLARYFDVVVAGGDCSTNKPEPEMMLAVAKGLGCAPAEMIMVGDGPQDIQAARAVGAHAVGVKGGILPLERLVASRPDVLLEDMGELLGYLRRRGLDR